MDALKSTESRTEGPCPNCGAELTDRYCGHCGQRAVDLRPTLRELLHEAVEEVSHFDGKLVRTIGLLLFRPGQLTREFLEGKRARSVTPVRLYLIASILFFGLMALLPAQKLKISVTNGDAQLTRAAERVNRDPAILAHALETAFPKAMFLLLPLFGLFVFAFYWRKERTYVPHLYFALHCQAFAFVVLALFEAIGALHWAPLIVARIALLVIPIVYLVIALRKVYGGGRLLTLAKAGAIVALYLLAALLVMAAIAYTTLRRLG